MPRISSFDVFDTSLVRVWARPTDLFLAAGEELKRRGMTVSEPGKWRELRIAAEAEARRRSRTEETTLDGIYLVLAEKAGWSPRERDAAARVETEIEADALRTVAETAQMIETARVEGRRIVFLSDMYLPAENVRGFLTAAGLWKEGDGLYVSSGHGLSKASGRLYRLFLEKEGAAPGDVTHTGDNEETDVRVPRRLGIETRLFSGARLNRFERRIADDVRLPPGSRSRLAGVSRAVRLGRFGDSAAEKTIAAVSASVAGPVLYGYVSWCLSEAAGRGIKRLYFISRDGQILLRVAERARTALGLKMDLRYLYGSRQAFHLPALEDFGEREFDWLLEDTSILSVRSFCARLGARPEDFAETFEAAGFPRAVWDENIAFKDRGRLRAVLENQDIRSRVKASASAARKDFLAYLEQEGVFDGSPWGLVDLGWRGRLQHSLSRALSLSGRYPADGVAGFYFALFDPVEPFGRDRLSAFLSEPGGRKALEALRGHIPVLEVFTAADHGLTLGYRRGEDGRMAPVLSEPKNEKILAWGLAVQQAAVENFAREWAKTIRDECVASSFWTAVAGKLLGLFLNNPTPAESAVYGDYLYSEDQADGYFHQLAPMITTGQFLSWCVIKGPLISRVTWVEAAVRRSFRRAGLFLAIVRLKSGLRKMGNRP